MTSPSLPSIVSSSLWNDFGRICDFGGRLAGTDGERAAFTWLEEAGRESTGVSPQSMPVAYDGWRAVRSRLRLDDGLSVQCHALVNSAATPLGGLTAEVVDLGRGSPEAFAAHSDAIAGRIVLVRHELMFASDTIHRRLKYGLAVQHGAKGFLIAGPLSGNVVAGSSGTEISTGIPAAGISPETAARLGEESGRYPEVTLEIDTERSRAQTKTLIFDMPGQSDEWVILSAHVDGHDLAESAIDNASGLAVALAVARQLAPEIAGMRHGLRLAFFSVEEWALTGSARYIESLSQEERARIALNVNLDSVAGGDELTALTSGYPGLAPLLGNAAEAVGVNLKLFLPLQMNSDHANFAQAGIPAFRLVAGFDDPTAATRFVLTPADTRDKVTLNQLEKATALTVAIVRDSLAASAAVAGVWRQR